MSSNDNGPARLAVAGTAGDWEAAVGEELDITLRARNDGGAGRGLAVQLWGVALTEKLVRPLRASVGNAEGAFEALEDRPGVLRAEIPAAEIPAGQGEPGDGAEASLPGEAAHADLEVTVRIEALAPAWTQLFVALLPTEPGTGQAATALLLSFSSGR